MNMIALLYAIVNETDQQKKKNEIELELCDTKIA